jgi:hypothetical protein
MARGRASLALSRMPDGSDAPFVVASHDALFARREEVRCDACDTPLAGDDEERTHGPPGAGVYMWSRGGDVRFEPVPLCPSCASAIGVTALARWEIEEEEG